MMTRRELVVEDKTGKVVRTIRWQGDNLLIIERGDSRRLEFHTSTAELEKGKVKYQVLGQIGGASALELPVLLPRECRLRLAAEDEKVPLTAVEREDSSDRGFLILWALLLLLGLGVRYGLNFVPQPLKFMEEEYQRQLVKIIRKQDVPKTVINDSTAEKVQAKTNKVALKRMGALAVLGSLSQGKQRGGLDLGAVNTSAGIGLGGTQGSGGVQTSLYGKGLISAPLGTGGNIKGAGGYGTKGAGGGQAGYGQISLIGSAGTSAFPLSRETIVDGGLDREAIAEVVRRNQGQIIFCYEQGLQGDPSLNGRVAVNWTIGAQGQVTIASVANTTVNAKIVEDCILMRLKTWKFPIPHGGKEVSVSYPFVLKRAGKG